MSLINCGEIVSGLSESGVRAKRLKCTVCCTRLPCALFSNEKKNLSWIFTHYIWLDQWRSVDKFSLPFMTTWTIQISKKLHFQVKISKMTPKIRRAHYNRIITLFCVNRQTEQFNTCLKTHSLMMKLFQFKCSSTHILTWAKPKRIKFSLKLIHDSSFHNILLFLRGKFPSEFLRSNNAKDTINDNADTLSGGDRVNAMLIQRQSVIWLLHNESLSRSYSLILIRLALVVYHVFPALISLRLWIILHILHNRKGITRLMCSHQSDRNWIIIIALLAHKFRCFCWQMLKISRSTWTWPAFGWYVGIIILRRYRNRTTVFYDSFMPSCLAVEQSVSNWVFV